MRDYIHWLLREYLWLVMIEAQILCLTISYLYLLAYVRLRTRQQRKRGLLRLRRRMDDGDDGKEDRMR